MKGNFWGILTAAIIIISFHSCEKEEGEDENETLISSYHSSESHKTGENCMECHKPGGSGEGWFTVAGTVYDAAQESIFPNATVNLYSENNGSGKLIASIQVDKKGNFYTTENIDFGNGIYTLVEGDADTEFMNSPVTNGQCNACHGISTDRIWTK